MTDRGRLVLGVDGGGTHTRALVAWENGPLVGAGQASGSNQASAGPAVAGRSLAQAIDAALGGAATRRDVAAACFGLAGIDRPGDRAAFMGVVEGLGLGCPVLLVNDAVAAWAGATGAAPGVVVIAGTGSIAYGRDADGTALRAGGWGAPFGDEGSAFDIGNRAIAAALRDVDRRGPHTLLTTTLAEHVAAGDPMDIGFAVRERARGGTLTSAIAALAPVVIAVAERGDDVALGIVRHAAGELAHLAWTVAATLGLSGADLRLVPRGSVIVDEAGRPTTMVGRLFAERLREMGAPEPQAALHSAAVGALILGWRRLHPGALPPLERTRAWSQAAQEERSG